MSTAAPAKKVPSPDAPAPAAAPAAGGGSKMDNPPLEKKPQLLNRPGEPEFKLELSPESVTFVCGGPDKKPVWCDLKLKNPSADLQCFKVKCTSADIFRVQPPLGFVKKDDTANIRVWFQNKVIPDANHKHYFAVYHVKSAEGKNVKDVWTKSTKPDGVRRLGAIFTDKPTA